MKVIDPVCKMEIDSNQAADKAVHQGETYYFCAPASKQAFENQPQKYAAPKT